MNTDIAPELLAQLKEDFDKAYGADKEIAGIQKRIADGTATGKDLDAYAARTGELLAEAMHRNISSDVLPNGQMYYNIASRILPPMLEKNYDLVADTAAEVYDQLNRQAGFGISGMRPEINRDRIDGLVELASSAERYDDVSGQVESRVVNYTQSVATDAVRENADFHYKSGLSPRIVRTATAGCCQWCQDLAGSYDYADVRHAGNDVYRRHANCRCTVEYDPGNDTRRQDVYTKRWTWQEDNEPLIEQRKRIDEVELFPNTTQMRVQAAWRLAATSVSPDGLTIREELEMIPYERAQEALTFYGNEIRDQPIEHAIVIQKNGQVLHFRCDKTNVGIFDADLDGAYITHNHPVSNGIISFSWDDLEFLIDHPQIARLECVNEQYNYSVQLLAPFDQEVYTMAEAEMRSIKYYNIEERSRDNHDIILEVLQQWGYVKYEARRIT